jgi:hypothetical protein
MRPLADSCSYGGMQFRSCALRTSQTIKQIVNKVPTRPYPNILASCESKIPGFRIPMSCSLNHRLRDFCWEPIPVIRGADLNEGKS